MDTEAFILDRDIELHPTNNIEAERIRGIHKDSSGKLWSIYLAEADEQDKTITELWRGEADSILIFTGLFSGIVTVFVTISYVDLYPSSAETTNFLLEQILRQLKNGTNSVEVVSPPQFVPSATTIRVTMIWFLSLVCSLASAIYATLFQQWSRRYLELTRHRVAPHKRARTRAYMFNGIASFKMSRAVKAMPMLLHISIFLFLAGLIDFMLHVNSTVGKWVLGFISAFSLAYLALTVLPNIYLNCPYSTPMSELSWRSSQRLLLFTLYLIQGLEGLLLRYRTWESSRWSKWKEVVRTQVKERRKWLKLGLQKVLC